MAITSAIMQMRRGEEEYFDPDKMHPGEWAVSTDKKYVRMCFSPGVCVRMATYEAFEEDMEQIIAILEEAKTVQEAIEKIYEEFQKAELDIEAAENSATLSESYAHGGTGTREGEDTDNAKYYAELAKENIEPVMNAVSDIALNRQTLGYSKKNLFKVKTATAESGGMTFTANSSAGTIVVNGTSSNSWYIVNDKIYFKAGDYIFTGCPEGGRIDGNGSFRHTLVLRDKDGVLIRDIHEYGDTNGTNFTVTQEMVDAGNYFTYTLGFFNSSTTADNLTFYPMVRSADITDDTFEPYVDDVRSILLNAGLDNYILSNTKWEDIEKDKNLKAQFFTNWSNETEFPAAFGSGIIIPALDGRFKFILYCKDNNVWSGLMTFTDKVTYTIKWKQISNDTILVENGNADDLIQNGKYYCGAGVSNKPESYGYLDVIKYPQYDGHVCQKFTGTMSGIVYSRVQIEGTWTSWQKLLTSSNVVNNLTATVPGSPLDAVQGKALWDRLTVVEDNTLKIFTPTGIDSFDSFKTTGLYHINFIGAINQPTANNGTLFVEFSVGTPYQMWIPDNSPNIYKRHFSSNAWSEWKQISGDWQALESRIAALENK